ncbi:MAG TPA: ribonuclease D, partial [Anaerolineaceae bacterium]
MKPPIWIDRPDRLRQMADRLVSFPSISVDTESNSLHAYREQVCLIQFSTTHEDYLVDPLALKDLSPLGQVFANPKIEKIFHAAEYDLICLRRDFQFKFASLFDTMMAGRILGRTAVGLGSMLEEEFGLQLDKRFQRANWAQRPLPPALLAYARLDTHYLLQLRNLLYDQLAAADRLQLAEEDFERMARQFSNGHVPEAETERVESVWRISGVQDLTPQQVAVLRELVHFRDRQAQAANLPPFKILSNQVLFAVAQASPHSRSELEETGALSPYQFDRFAAGLLDAVEHGL